MDHAHLGGVPGLILPSAIILGRDVGGTVTDDLLGGHEVILVDQFTDLGPAEIVPA